MPLIRFLGYPYVTLNSIFSKIYWTEITKGIRYDYGYGRIDKPEIVKEALSGNLDYLLESFKDLIKEFRSIPFLLFVHRIHESSIFISDKVQNEDERILDVLTEQDVKEVPAIRRVLKLIMEELLIEEFSEEVNDYMEKEISYSQKNIKALEELLYVGIHALETIELLNIALMFKKSIALNSHKKERLTISIKNPYFQIFEDIKRDMWTYATKYYHDLNYELDVVLKETFNIDFNIFQHIHPKILGSLIVSKQDFINEIKSKIDGDERLEVFLNGLILNFFNKLTLDKSFLKSQENYRLTYRPIIEIKDKNGDESWILGKGKTFESIHAIRTNALLWGKLPSEWKQIHQIKDFGNEMELSREKAMMDVVSGILESRQIKYDKDIKSLKKENGQGFRIDTAGLGQIDLIFLNEKEQIIYVCECKNNRPRFDTFNWKSDYEQFTSSSKKRNYEIQLTNKFNWVNNNKELIQHHFNFLLGSNFNFDNWQVKGEFILMTPSIYKYDGLFLVLTVEDLEIFIDNGFRFHYPDLRFERKDGSYYEIKYPYFKHINKLVDIGIL